MGLSETPIPSCIGRIMISECFNPSCHKKLDYLRAGRVVRVIRAEGSWISVEHFWLCGSCYLAYDFHFEPDGTVSLARKPEPVSSRNAVADHANVA